MGGGDRERKRFNELVLFANPCLRFKQIPTASLALCFTRVRVTMPSYVLASHVN